MAWRVFAAAAVGKSHIDGGIPCQDAVHHVVRDGLLLAAVCDGAGSKSQSHDGAAIVARDVVAGLSAAIADEAAFAALDAAAVGALVAAAVAAARDALTVKAQAAGHAFDDYSSTLVGVIAGAAGGWFFHIGDGFAVADREDPAASPWISLPENGEYANETYFVTGEQWREHLRVLAIDAPTTRIALMSDGAAAFVMAKGNGGLFRAFTDPVEKFLLGVADPVQADAALQATLADPRTHGITGDDKTLLLALRD